MVLINEWFPNPAGSDAQNEFVELYNNGSASVNLNGWVLKTASSKASLNSAATLGAGDYLVLKRSETKLVLKNSDEKLFLYDAGGKLVDQSAFLGLATEGKSFSRLRQNYGGQARINKTPSVNSQMFTWSDPTPGAANSVTLDAAIIKNIYPADIPLNANLGSAGLTALIISSALAITAFVMFALKKHENLSQLFFGRDEEIW